MNYTPLVILVAVVVLVVTLISYNTVQERKRRRARVELASLRGWTYTPGGPGRRHYLLEGSCDGGPWQVEARVGGKNNPGHSSFKCPGASAAGGVVCIGAPGLDKFLQSGLGQTLAHWGLHLGGMLGADTAILERLLENPIPLEDDGTEFGKLFSVLTTDPSLAHKLLTSRAKEAILGWRSCGEPNPRRAQGLQASWSQEGLSLHWQADLYDPEEMVSFAELGMTLVKESRGSSGW